MLRINSAINGLREINPATLKAMAELRINETRAPYSGIRSLLIGFILITQKPGNALNAISIVLMMALAIRAGDFKNNGLEIPF